jgi:hypothetical protein
MAVDAFTPGPHSPLQRDEVETIHAVIAHLERNPAERELAAAITEQAASLEHFGALLARYPSPLEAQTLGGRHRGLDTLVEALSTADLATFTMRAPTQAIVGRALNLAQINFFRLLWHVCGELDDVAEAAPLRERTARRLRTAVYAQLVEDVLSDLSTDDSLSNDLRTRAVRLLVHVWGHRRTWHLNESFTVLEATWEARTRVRVVGGSLLGTCEMFQLMAQGADERFVELLLGRDHGTDETLAFREFLFGRSSEELDVLTERMAQQGLSSLQLDGRMLESGRDAGSIFYEFFQARLLQSNARRLASLPGPKHPAEGYVVLAWLAQDPRAARR